jgi:hypothetical protein
MAVPKIANKKHMICVMVNCGEIKEKKEEVKRGEHLM